MLESCIKLWVVKYFSSITFNSFIAPGNMPAGISSHPISNRKSAVPSNFIARPPPLRLRCAFPLAGRGNRWPRGKQSGGWASQQGALGGGNDAARVQQIEKVRALQAVIVSRQQGKAPVLLAGALLVSPKQLAGLLLMQLK